MTIPTVNDWRRRDRTRQMAAIAVAAVAVVGILSATSAPLRGRFKVVLEIVPFHATRGAATTLVLASFALLLTARGLRRGGRLAWAGTLALLVLSVGLNLAKGLDIEEAVLALGAGAWLATRRRAFPVLPTRAAARMAAILGVGGAAGALVFGVALSMAVGRRHHPHLGESTRAVAERLGGNWALPLPGAGPFVTPMLVAVGIGLVGSTLWLLLSPRPGRRLSAPAHLAERERARRVVAAHGGGTLDYFALRDDKDWFFYGESVVAHSVRRGVCLVSPDPIGPDAERAAALAAFLAFTQREGWSVAVIGASAAWLPLYQAAGMRPLYMGDEAVVDCGPFTLEGPPMKSLRGAYARVERAGYTADFIDPADLTAEDRAALEALTEASRHGEAERGFSMTLSRLCDPHDEGLLLTVVRDAERTVQAFVQWMPAAKIGGWSLDVMRRNPSHDLPNGVMDFAIVATILHLAPTGGGLGLNFAMFREVVASESPSGMARLSKAALRAFSGKAQVESLWRFNSKYNPDWIPRYVVLDSLDLAVTQGFVMADAEGVTELPLIGRFLGGTP
ncbi:MAG TPA: phosphatidylglycerol lysyltransferase domain-containing protein [Demequinaceae bacterium]